jgi:creatinine amidohydrolase
MDLSQATWTDVADGDATAAFVPVGSTEQHGPHAPLGTDTLTATAIAERAADVADERVLVTPAIPVGIAAEHRAFDGTLWVSPDTFRAYVREAAESLLASGVDRVVFVNGHGGNSDALREVAAQLTRDTGAHVAAFTWFEALDAYPDEMGHAGAIETAVLEALAPETVRSERLDAAADGASEAWGDVHGATNVAYDSDQFTESGVVGDPRAATAERGAALVEEAVDALLDVLAALEGS